MLFAKKYVTLHIMKYRNLIIYAIVALVLFAAAQLTQQYRFYAKEAENLWMNDSQWIADTLLKPGGFSQFVTSALTQFYALPFVGPLVFALIGTLTVVCSDVLARTFRASLFASHSGRAGLFPIGLLVPVFLFLSHENAFYNLRGDIALLMALAFALLVRVRWKMLYGFIVLLEYCLIGSATIVTVAIFTIASLLRRRWIEAALPPVALLAAGCLACHMGTFTSFEQAFSPLQYYEWPSTYYFQIYAWVAAVIGCCRIFAPAVLVAAPAIGFGMYSAVHNEKNYALRTDEWHVRQHDWQAIISHHEGRDERNCFVSYINLALAETGQLTERLFEFSPYTVSAAEANAAAAGQQKADAANDHTDGYTGASLQASAAGEETMVCAPILMRSDELSRDGQKQQSIVMYRWGGAALCNAQKAAFETNMLTPGCCDPEEMKRLVVTNMVFDTPLVAAKYLRRLQRTTFYHDWATQLLADMAPLKAEADQLRKSLPHDNTLYMKTQVVKTLRSITETAPDNQVAAQFYEAYLLLSIDRQGLRHWAEKRHAQGRPLSTLLQQALLLSAPADTEQSLWFAECERLGVGKDCIGDFRNLLAGSYPSYYDTSFWNFYARYTTN